MHSYTAYTLETSALGRRLKDASPREKEVSQCHTSFPLINIHCIIIFDYQNRNSLIMAKL